MSVYRIEFLMSNGYYSGVTYETETPEEAIAKAREEFPNSTLTGLDQSLGGRLHPMSNLLRGDQ